MGTNQNPSTVASIGMRAAGFDRLSGNAPIASRHGSGLPFAGTTAATAATYAAPQLAAARKDDARVPDPRGRQR